MWEGYECKYMTKTEREKERRDLMRKLMTETRERVVMYDKVYYIDAWKRKRRLCINVYE